jgi:hypothetical protein
MSDRIVYILLATMVASLPFELRDFPILSNLQWLFLALGTCAVPILIRERRRLLGDRLVLAALLFVLTQWLAALLSAEFTLNAIKGAVRVSAGLTLLCVTSCLREKHALLRVWSVSAVLAAVYGILDYNGLGAPGLFRETEFYFGQAMRLSGSFEYPNTAAAYFALSLPVIWTTPKVRIVRVLASIPVWVALVMTYSRGAAIAVLLILLSWGVIGKIRWPLYLTVFYAGAFVAFLVFQPIWLERFKARPPAKSLSAEYEPEFNWLRRAPDEPGELVVRVRNTGAAAWLARGGSPFTISYWWYDAERKEWLPAPTIFTPIPALQPQESASVRVSFRTPAMPGLYLLTWDISQTGANWFSGVGVVPGIVEVEIQPGAAPASGQTDLSRWYRPEISKLYVANLPLSRTELWEAGLTLARQHPVLGVGPDNFRLLYGDAFRLSRWDTNIRSNNLYLELLSGSGLVGLAAFVFMITRVRWKAGASGLALGIFLLHGTVDVFLMTTPIYFAFWILLGEGQDDTEEGANLTKDLRVG